MKKCYFAVIIVMIIFISGCTENNNSTAAPFHNELFALDTIIDFTIYGENTEEVSKLCETRIYELEQLLTVTGDNSSEICHINETSDPVKVSQDTINVIKTACEVYNLSSGSLDPTIYPIIQLWGFTADEQRVPASDEIKNALSLVDGSKINIDEQNMTVSLPDNMQIDLGAVAKGYISQEVKNIMKENGICSAVLSFGGNIQTIGLKDGEEWRIGVKYPFSNDSFIILNTGETSVVTSATDQRYFTENGKMYHHIIDPATGYPLDNGILSVTVVCENGTKADALSTALFVMGKSSAEELWRKSGDFDYILLDSNNNVFVTEGVKEKINTTEKYSYLKVNYIVR